ncbi:hypothetical protein GGI35DRAFT_451604 [Trichoderma velutinum]
MGWSIRKDMLRQVLLVLFAWPPVGCSASVFTGCCAVCCGYVVLCCVALCCVALLPGWQDALCAATLLSSSQTAFNASNCRMCMRGRRRRCWGCKWEPEIKRKRETKVCVCVCVCGRARHRDSQQKAGQVGVEIHDANASCDSFG